MTYTNYDSYNPHTFIQPSTSKWEAFVKANTPSDKLDSYVKPTTPAK